MTRFSQRVYEKRKSRFGPTKAALIGSTPKTQCSAVFFALGISATITAYYTSGSPIQLLSAFIALTFLGITTLVVREHRLAPKIGYITTSLLILLLLLNVLFTGSAGVGILWLFVLLFALKKLYDFDRSLASKQTAP